MLNWSFVDIACLSSTFSLHSLTPEREISARNKKDIQFSKSLTRKFTSVRCPRGCTRLTTPSPPHPTRAGVVSSSDRLWTRTTEREKHPEYVCPDITHCAWSVSPQISRASSGVNGIRVQGLTDRTMENVFTRLEIFLGRDTDVLTSKQQWPLP
ncbi:hypothetical protein BaRGS_00004977 [Batillaria attramentaria]|uniref:Uncharacterized protein n=1 Tax=Batillaria attramentaria TaxID=370345 RepID=A0ABD0LW24_9CAEN